MRRTTVSVVVLTAVLAGACGQGGVANVGNVTDIVGPPRDTSLLGVPPGAHASGPAGGKVVLDISPSSASSWRVYADGRVIWQRWSSSGDPIVIPKGGDPRHTAYVERRLTPQGAQELRSTILAVGRSSGLFSTTCGWRGPGSTRQSPHPGSTTPGTRSAPAGT